MVPCRESGERPDLMAFLYVMFSCVVVTVPYDVLGQVWYLIVRIPDIWLLPFLDPDQASAKAN